MPPIIGIGTAPVGGTNATAVAIMTSRTGQVGKSIDRIQITNPGFGYTIAPIIRIRSQNAVGTGAAATAIMSEGSLGTPSLTFRGNGYLPGSPPNVAIGTAPAGGTDATAVAIVNTNGEVSSIQYTNAGSGYIEAPSISIDAPITGIVTDNYLEKEVVRGVSTGTTAIVAGWDSEDRILKVSRISTPGFTIGEFVVGIGTTQRGSDARYKISTMSDQDEYDEFSNNKPFEDEADNILDFTESNPFGEY